MTRFIKFKSLFRASSKVNSVCTACSQKIASSTTIVDLVPSEIAHHFSESVGVVSAG